MKLDLDKKIQLWSWKIWVLGFEPYLQYQAQRNRSDQQCSDFIFLQWCYSICFKYCKKTFWQKPNVLQCGQKFIDLWSSHHVSGNVGVLQSKLKKLLTHVVELKLCQPQFCDKVMQEFLEFVGHEMKLYSDVFQSFKRDKTSLDVFFFSYTDMIKYKELSSLVKMILTLRHVQGAL